MQHIRSRGAVQPAPDRSTARWGIGFVLLLLVSGGMVTVPGDREGVAFVRDFYQDNAAVVVIAQVVGLAAAAVFVGFARRLQDSDWVGAAPWVHLSGAAVGGAAALAAAPPIALSMVSGSIGDEMVSGLARASDLVDVALFTVIAVFAGTVAAAVRSTWLRLVCVLVALLSVLRAALLTAGSQTLEVAAPMAFVALVLVLTWSSWRRHRHG